ncbi:triacylglycerol lipase OBL1-like [Benincasa hispida]|uniref:triacylglycerol lipase OBL1-like n=1 Tax=Benincasa hispida TaxID=102211 RepID=UPI001900DB57|nr:triacylglycerol lipase OBL1-like [Benincasa hispida]
MVVFFSLLLQKILILFSKKLAELGSMVEFYLNLISSNGGLFMLFRNFYQGKVEISKPKSEKFMSFIGQINTRVELDSSIKPGDCRYFSSLTVMASKLSYENHAFVKTIVQDYWKMELIGFYNFWNDFQEKHTTNAFILQDKTSNPSIILVVFRGTEMFDANAWCTDIDLSWYELPEKGKIHGGFIKALGLQRKTGWPKDIKPDPDRPVAYYFIREQLKELLRLNHGAKFIITGHSLGGALAALFPSVLALHEETRLLNRYFRFVYSNDIVTRLPTNDPNFIFKHFGTCLYFNSCYKGKDKLQI